jgi:hypothetical protein
MDILLEDNAFKTPTAAGAVGARAGRGRDALRLGVHAHTPTHTLSLSHSVALSHAHTHTFSHRRPHDGLAAGYPGRPCSQNGAVCVCVCVCVFACLFSYIVVHRLGTGTL